MRDTHRAIVDELVQGGLEPGDLAPDDRPPVSIGRFAVEGELGRGGMGVVFAARDREVDRPVALKLVHGAWTSADVTRLRREARALGQLDDHPGIVRLLEVGTHAGRPFLVMERVEGETLAERVAAGQELAATLRVVAEVADALAFAHGRGVVHRDVKPANVLIRRRDGAAVLTDFGLAHDERVDRMTRTGGVVGTLAYLAPEQGRGEVGPASDVYALGALLFEATTGRPVFEADSVLALLTQLGTRPPPRVRSLAPLTDPRLARLIDTCLLARVEARPSASALAARLREILASPPPRGRPGLLLWGAAGALGLVAGLSALPYVRRPPTPAAASTAAIDSAVEVTFDALGWGHERPELQGLRLASTTELGVRSGCREFKKRGESQLELAFDLPQRPAWARLRLDFRALRVARYENHGTLIVELNDELVSRGSSASDFWIRPQAGPNLLRLTLDPQARSRVLVGAAVVEFGQGPPPRGDQPLRWDYQEPRPGELTLVQPAGVRRDRSLRLQVGPAEALEFEFECDFAPDWGVLERHGLGRVDLHLDGEALLEAWSGEDALELPAALLTAGTHRLRLTRSEGFPATDWLRWIELRYGDGATPPASRRVVTRR